MVYFYRLSLALAVMIGFLPGIGMELHAKAAPATMDGGMDSIPRNALVFVEGFDAAGKSISVSVGVIVKKGFVALNYHYLVGATEVKCFKPGETTAHISNGFLSVEENQDLIVISVPTIEGSIANLSPLNFPGNGSTVQLTGNADQRRLIFGNAMVSGTKDILGKTMPQMVSTQMEDCTGGPIFQGNQVVGFAVAGYLDDQRYYAYGIPAYELKRLLNRSFIIKTFSATGELAPTPFAPFQGNLMESLEAVLWQSFSDAERVVLKRKKMVLIDVSTKWAGWSNLMEKNTYTKKGIIRYLNENYYPIRMDAESNDTIVFNRLAYHRNSGSPYHTLAYSLLEGNMQFPSTVILDEELNELLVIPGYMDAKKMEVVLHYFFEKAYLNVDLSFQQYESRYWEKLRALDGN
jgi:thioredoxin-related protein